MPAKLEPTGRGSPRSAVAVDARGEKLELVSAILARLCRAKVESKTVLETLVLDTTRSRSRPCQPMVKMDSDRKIICRHKLFDVSERNVR